MEHFSHDIFFFSILSNFNLQLKLSDQEIVFPNFSSYIFASVREIVASISSSSAHRNIFIFWCGPRASGFKAAFCGHARCLANLGYNQQCFNHCCLSALPRPTQWSDLSDLWGLKSTSRYCPHSQSGLGLLIGNLMLLDMGETDLFDADILLC